MIKKLNPILLICAGAMIILTFLAAYFYKERMVFIDSSFYIFELCKTGSLFIGHSRFGGVIVQLLPYLAMKMHMSLSVISFLYSISYLLYNSVLTALLWFVFKDKKGAIAIVLLQCLLVTFTFFWPISELAIALTTLVFFQSYLQSKVYQQNITISAIIGLPLMAFTLVFFHPLIVIAIIYLFVFLLIGEDANRPYRFASLAMLVFFYIIRTLFIKTPYDESARSGLSNVLPNLTHYFSLTSTKNSIKYFVYDYYMASLAMIFSFVMLMFKRKVLLAVFFAISIIGMWMLINLNYPDGGSQFYLENQYNIMAFMTVIALTYSIFDDINIRWQSGIISIIVLVGIIRIGIASSTFTHRLDYYRNLMSETEHLPNKKLIIDGKHVPQDTLMMSWCAAYEIWHLSTMEQGKSRSILIEESDKEFEWVIGKKNEFHQKFGNQPYKDLNPRYFIFNDTTAYIRK